MMEVGLSAYVDDIAGSRGRQIVRDGHQPEPGGGVASRLRGSPAHAVAGRGQAGTARLHRGGRPVRTCAHLPRAGGPGQGKRPNTGRCRAWKTLPSRQRVWLRRARPSWGGMAPC